MTVSELQNILKQIKTTEFNCEYNGIANKHKILTIELETGMAYVEFVNEVTVVKAKSTEMPFSNSENEYAFVEENTKTRFGWIRIFNPTE